MESPGEQVSSTLVIATLIANIFVLAIAVMIWLFIIGVIYVILETIVEKINNTKGYHEHFQSTEGIKRDY